MVNRCPVAARLLVVVSALAFAMPAAAQTDEESYGPEPAHVGYIDGVATVTREGRAEPATINIPLVSGDQLSTREGRIEVLFGDGSVLDVDHFTTLDFLSDELVRLTEGRIRLTVGGRDQVAYRIDTPSGAVRIQAPGEYRVALVGESGRSDIELVTIRGFAALINDFGETTVRAGERAFAAASMAPSYAQPYNSATWDAFDRWAADRRDERTGSVSVEYLPDDVRTYAGDFDRYGDWRQDVSYGYVWYPRVRVDWRPYYHGRWHHYQPWGWTWIAYDRWGWATHHYGRWGFRSGAWFWIPSRRWAPAYVHWAGASDYIGWCPLGWDNRPIFNVININIGRGYRGYDPYRAWTVVPRGAFGHRLDVRRHALARAQIDRAVPRWYVSGASAPVRPALTVRNTTPIYTPGRAGASRRGFSTAPAGDGGASGAARVAPRGSVAPRSYTRSRPGSDAPRTIAPAAPGTLGQSAGWQRSRQRPDRAGVSSPGSAPRARYRDVGPGGSEPGRQSPEFRSQRPQSNDWPGRSYGRPEDGGPNPGSSDRARGRSERDRSDGMGAAPRGVPSGGIYGSRGVPADGGRVYAPRGVPRGEVPRARIPGGYTSGTERYPAPRSEGPEAAGGYSPRRSVERRSYGSAPSGPPPSAGRPSYAPPSPRSAPSAGRPGGGDRGRERAAPRGGSAPPRPGSGHSRARPR